MRGFAIPIAIAVGAFGGCATPARPAKPPPALVGAPSAVRGQAFAQRACASCHAIGRSGRSAMAHAPSFRDLAQRRTDADIARTMAELPTHGHSEMPRVLITDDELKDIAAYIATLRGRPA